MSLAALDRSRPPATGALRDFRFPGFERRRLGSGLELRLAPLERGPLVALELVAPAGAEHDPASRAGLAALTAALLDEGTGRRPAREVAATIERLGGRLGTSAGWSAGLVSAGAEASHLTAALGLLAEVVTDPALHPDELERARRRRLTELVRLRDQPAAQAALWLSRAIYGDGRYGTSSHGDADSVSAITREDVAGFYRRHYPLAGCTLIATGEVTQESLQPALEALDVAAQAATSDASLAPEVSVPLTAPQPSGRRVVVVDRPGATQVNLRLGQAAIPRSHPDHLRLAVMSSLLGGKFTSRLNLNLRERHGYTYGVQSQLAERRGPGPFLVGTAVGTAVAGAAVGEILHEIELLRQEPVPREELADAQSYLIGLFPFTLQTAANVASRLTELVVHRLPDDYFQRYPEAIRAVDAEAILRVAREHLAPERMAIVAVGPAEALRGQLAAFGEVEVVEPI